MQLKLLQESQNQLERSKPFSDMTQAQLLAMYGTKDKVMATIPLLNSRALAFMTTLQPLFE